MRIARFQISNFRNFKALDIALGDQAVIVGQNKIGKSNLLYALRLVLDPALPDSARQLRFDDFWDGLERPLGADDKITIAVDLTDFEDDENHAALLAEHLIEGEPMTSRLTYSFEHCRLSRVIQKVKLTMSSLSSAATVRPIQSTARSDAGCRWMFCPRFVMPKGIWEIGDGRRCDHYLMQPPLKSTATSSAN
ncbi:MAG TPA: AAA family ATPase [Vicinamibacterales bacterium]|nr:AAA family ATPase [Vicinamibacterales bacterium]